MRFANIIVVGFGPIVVNVGDIHVGMLNAGYFVKASLWLKTCLNSNGRQWSILQTLETRFFFRCSWPFEMA
jgi:hypothetical protein